MLRHVAAALLVLAAATSADELFNSRVAFLEPFPRQVARSKKISIKGSLKGGYKDPELILIAPNGKTYLNKYNEILPQDFTFTVRFEEGPGPYRLELIVKKWATIRSAMRVTVYYGVPEPAEEDVPPPATGDATPVFHHPRLVEKHFLQRLNRFRADLGLKPAAWNEAVAARAREHATRMAGAERRLHRFATVGGVDDMLERDGAGPSGLSGPDDAWERVTGLRPFERHRPQPPGPRAQQHVVVQIVADVSQEAMFENYFARQPAFRICAADPNLVEVAVGAARTPPPEGSRRLPHPLVYYCVCFVQVNDIRLIRAQNRAYDELLKRGREREPEILRALGVWGRDDAVDLLREAHRDPRPEVKAAAFDALLLLDEEKARAGLRKLADDALRIQERGRYAEAIGMLEPYRLVVHDSSLPEAVRRRTVEANSAARKELKKIRKLTEPLRTDGLQDLLGRCGGLETVESIERELAKPK